MLVSTMAQQKFVNGIHNRITYTFITRQVVRGSSNRWRRAVAEGFI